MTQEEKYEDFKLFLYDLECEMRANQRSRGEMPTFKLTDMFVKFSPENLKLHQQILARITKYGASEAELAGFVDAVKKSKVGGWCEKMDLESIKWLNIDKNTNNYHAAETVLHHYMCYYYNKYFRVNDGEIVYTGLDRFDYNNSGDPDRKALYTTNYFPLIVLKNGECYFSHLHHQELAWWLNAQGKSLSGAIRMTANKRRMEFTVSDISKDKWTDEAEKKEDFKLTSAQARAIFDVTVTQFGAEPKSINQMVMMSDIFGNGAARGLKKSEIKNLMELEESSKGYFSISEYIDGLKHRANKMEWGS